MGVSAIAADAIVTINAKIAAPDARAPILRSILQFDVRIAWTPHQNSKWNVYRRLRPKITGKPQI
jgi:hypothetical protein